VPYELHFSAASSVTSVTVNFGDGNTQTFSGNNVAAYHPYSQAGTYTLTATAHDAVGTSDAVLDNPGFGSDGSGSVTLSTGTDVLTGTSLAIGSGGKIIVAGISDNGLTIARMSQNGILDTTFGTSGGMAWETLSGAGSTVQTAVQPDGKIMLAYTVDGTLTLSRLTSDGLSFDSSFGTGGTFTTGDSVGSVTGMRMALNGDISVAGAAGSGGRYYLDKVLPDGGSDRMVAEASNPMPAASNSQSLPDGTTLNAINISNFCYGGMSVFRTNPDGSPYIGTSGSPTSSFPITVTSPEPIKDTHSTDCDCPGCCTESAGTGNEISYAFGVAQSTTSIMDSAGFTGGWAVLLNWTPRGEYLADNTFGYGWMNNRHTFVQKTGGDPDHPNFAVVNTAYAQFQFNYNATTGSYAPAAVTNDSFVHDATAGTFTWLDSGTGGTSVFYDLGSGTTANLQGKLKSKADAAGNTTDLTYNGSGQLTTVAQANTAGDSEYFNYAYATSGPSAGQVSSVQQTMQRAGETAPTLYRQSVYSYYQGTYTGDDAYGNQGDLKTVAVEDADGNVISELYYRYYTPMDIDNGQQGYVGGLKYTFTSDGFTKLSAIASDPFTATDDQAAPYADNFYAYDAAGKAISTTASATGASSGDGGTGSGSGQGDSQLAYYQNPDFPGDGTADFNTWRTRATETLPNGNQNIVYTNINQDILLAIQVDNVDPVNSANVGKAWITGTQYDSSGRPIASISTSAIDTSFYTLDNPSAYEQYADVGLTEGGVNSSTGLIDTTTYYSSTTATSSTPGGAEGYKEADYVQQGLSGTPIEQDSTTYIAHTDANGNTMFQPASSTVYRNTDGTGAETTSVSYTYYSGTNQPYSVTTSAPVVSSGQNGPGTADVTTDIYDTYGRVIWSQDPNGYISYTGYDLATGAVVQTIQDVNTSDLFGLIDDVVPLPFDWTASNIGQPTGWPSAITFTPPTASGQAVQALNWTEAIGAMGQTYGFYGNSNWAIYDESTFDGSLTPNSYGSGVQAGDTLELTMSDSSWRFIWTTPSADYSAAMTAVGSGSLVSDANSWGSTGFQVGSYGTRYQVDNLGRTTEETSPNGNVTYTVYDDAHHAVFSLPGATETLDGSGNGTLETTGPITMVRSEIPYTYMADSSKAGTYDETLTFSGTVTVANGHIVLPGFNAGFGSTTGFQSVFNIYGNSTPQFRIQSLARTVYNTAGQAVENDTYPSISDFTYFYTYANSPYSGTPFSPSSSFGMSTGNYYASYQGYDGDGRAYKSVNANGTITDTVFDGLSRPVATWVGTNDAINSGTSFNGTNAGTGNNMTEVSSAVYDGGGVGDSNVTQATQYVDGTSSHNRVSQVLYDFRDRMVATKSGVASTLGAETDGIGRPITVSMLDNLGETTASFVFDGDGIPLSDFASGVSVTTSGGHTVATVDASALRSYSTTAYDDQGRVYHSATYSVDPTTGYISADALTSNTFYDHRGETIEQTSPAGLVSKMTYDGIGREVMTYSTDGGAVNNGGVLLTTWAAAGSVANDIVLEQTASGYDPDGNAIETADGQRFNTDPTSGGTSEGALFTSTTNSDGSLSVTPDSSGHLDSRIYYTASYFNAGDRDIADVNVGNNAGSTWTRPSSVPSRSDTVLVTSTTYNAAGWTATTTDPRGIESETLYDNLGRTLYTIAAWDGTYDPTSGLPSSGDANQTTGYTYDGDNNQLSMTAVMPSATPSQTTAYIYGVTTSGGSTINSNDLLQKVEYPNPSTGAASTSASAQNSYTYNAAGQVITKTDQNGTVHTYTYDVLGRQTSDAVTIASGNPENIDTSVLRIETNYNSQGLIYQTTSYNAASGGSIVNQVENLYNDLGQLTAQYQSVSGAVNTSTTPAVQYAYSDSSAGRVLTSMTYPNGRILHYGYDGSTLDTAIGRLSYLADDNGSGGVGQHLEEYAYLGLNTAVARNHPETGINLTYIQQSGDTLANTDGGDQYTGLDRFGQIIDQNDVDTSTSTSTDRFQYSYDRDGNVLAKNNLVNSSESQLYHANSTTSGDDNTAYDPLNRLVSYKRGTLSSSGNNGSSLDTVITNTASQNYSLDAVGNMSSVTTNGTSQSRSANSQNQYTTVGSSTLAYDSNGNTTTDETGKQYVYDAWNRLVAVKDTVANGSGTLETFAYDGRGYRITETVTSTSTTTNLYYSSQWQVIEERQGGTTTTQYVWSPVYVDALILRDSNITSGSLGISGSGLGQRLYVQQDANYNVTAIVGYDASTSTWKVVERYIYDPYGNFTVLDPSWTPVSGNASGFGMRYLFQGGRFDTISSLFYFDNRDYRPTLQRWMRQDPIGYINGVNTYQALGSNPTSHRDPTGLYYTSTEGPFLYLNPQTGEMGVYFVRRRLPGWFDRHIWFAECVGDDGGGGTTIAKYPILVDAGFRSNWNQNNFKNIPDDQRMLYLDEIAYAIRLEASNGTLYESASVTMDGFLLACGLAVLSGAVGIGGRTLSPAEQGEFDAFAQRARSVGLQENAKRTGSWGTIDANGKFQEVCRVDVGEAGKPGFRGQTHIHISGQDGHLPLTTKLPGEQ
jgi:RHS repeat-associated protein